MSDERESASVNRGFAARIVAAYVRRNQVTSDQLASLIATVHRAIAELGKPPGCGGTVDGLGVPRLHQAVIIQIRP